MTYKINPTHIMNWGPRTGLVERIGTTYFHPDGRPVAWEGSAELLPEDHDTIPCPPLFAASAIDLYEELCARIREGADGN